LASKIFFWKQNEHGFQENLLTSASAKVEGVKKKNVSDMKRKGRK
jgi:hypothetical protein